MKRRASILLVTFLLPAGLSAGCGDDGAPSPPPPPPASLVTAGNYQLTNQIDLTASALLPDPVHTYLDLLRGLRDDPGATLFKVLDEAGVPLATELQAALPDVLESRLNGWINDYVFGAQYKGVPVRDELDALLAATSTVLTRFDLASELELPMTDAQGSAVATHRLTELRYAPFDGIHVTVLLDPASLDPAQRLRLVLERQAAARASVGTAGADAHLTLDDHSFGLPYGVYALMALDLGLQQRYGAGLGPTLGALFQCPALGASVAGKCVLGVCVGHADDLTAICEQGVDLVAQQVRDRIAALSFDALRLQHGEAAMWDAPAAPGAATDSRIDRLSDGVWKAAIDIGMGAREVPAHFSGVRP